MSSIHKLGIFGIRSYSPEEEAVIKFFRPLTLILGKNGAGKTTIIECLKMAVSGTLPPNSNGGKTFICDPKIVNRPEVKAKIEIAFTTLNQRKVLAIRTFQLTHTDKKTEFRQVDQILKAKDLRGEIISVTNKCAEMDKQIPELLGVSQAVLDNVIFCHQEESLWPFGETSKLKSIFDELFDTTTFTNLLENLKKIKKEYKKTAKDAMGDFQLEKKDFDHLLKMEKGLLGEMDDIGELQKQIEAHEGKIRVMKEKVRTDEEKSDLEKNMNLLKYKKSENEKRLDEIRTVFAEKEYQIFSENTVDDLRKGKDDMIKAFEKKENDFRICEQKLDELRQEKENKQRQMDQIQNSDKEISEVNIKLRDCRDKISNIITLSISGNEIDEKINEKVLNETQALLAGLQREVETDKRKKEEDENKLESLLNNARVELSSKQGMLDLKSQELDQCNIKITTLNREIVELTRITKNKPRNANSAIEELNEQIDNLRETHKSFSESYDLKTKEFVELSNSISLGSKTKDLILRKQELEELQKKLQNSEHEFRNYEKEIWLLATSLSELSDMKFDDEATSDVLLGVCRSFERTKKLEKENLIAKRDKVNDSLKEASSYVQIKTNEYKNKKREVNEFMTKMEGSQLQALLDQDNDFPTQYQAIKDKLKQAEKRELAMHYTEDIMTKLFEKSQQSKKCAICIRKLEEPEIQKIEAKCKEIIAKSSNFTGNEQRNLEELRQLKHQFKGMKAEYEEFRRNKTILNQLEREIQSKEKEMKIFQQQFDNYKNQTEMFKNIDDILEQIKIAGEKLGKSKMETEEFQTRIASLKSIYPELLDNKAMLRLVPVDEKRNQEKLAYVKKETEELREKVNQVDSQIRRLQDQKLELDRSRENSEKDFVELERKTKELEELKAKKLEIDSSLKKVRDDIETQRGKVENLEEKRNDLRAKMKQADNKGFNASKLKELLEEFKRHKDQWADLNKKKSNKKEAEFLRDKLSGEIQKITENIAQLTTQYNKLRDTIKDKDKNVRMIEDNITLKVLEEEEQAIERDFEKISKSYKDWLENDKQNKALKAEIEKETARFNQANGKYQVLVDKYQKEFGEVKSKFSQTEKSYVEKYFKANINDSVVDDLDIYITNLEKALMMFHKQKMEEINKIIADLWIKTYQGNDIKKIEIKSDVEPGTNTRNKSFNYRIVFFNTDNKELDMKGRCSMGQKVIASIVIRLALAEAFCINCGILALDEPTTNLDKDHIKKLAKQLSNLIEDRCNNENFQLILITHDKEFLREMREWAEEYYKVYKDDHYFSRIERQKMSSL